MRTVLTKPKLPFGFGFQPHTPPMVPDEATVTSD